LKKEQCDKWKRELLGWDDGDVYIFRPDRGNFSIKRHPELHRKLVDIAIKYLEEHDVKSEEELTRLEEEVIETLLDMDWQNMANVLHEVSKIVKDPDVHQEPSDVEKQILEIARLVANLNAAGNRVWEG